MLHLPIVCRACSCLIVLWLTAVVEADGLPQNRNTGMGWRMPSKVNSRQKANLPPSKIPYNSLRKQPRLPTVDPSPISTASLNQQSSSFDGVQLVKFQDTTELVPTHAPSAINRRRPVSGDGRSAAKPSTMADPPPRPPLELGLSLLDDDSPESPKAVAATRSIAANDDPIQAGRPYRSRPTIAPRAIHLGVAARCRLEAPDAIQRIEIANRNVCDVVSKGVREATLIAKAGGTTSLTVWFGAPLIPVRYHVRVGDAGGGPWDDQDARLQARVAKKFPNSDITVVSQDETLIVSGIASSEREAINILSAIRDQRWVPVVDRVEVRR